MVLHKYNNPFKSDWFLWFDFGGWRFLNKVQIDEPSSINLPPYKGLMNQLNNPTRLTIGMESPNNIMKQHIKSDSIKDIVTEFCKDKYAYYDDFIQGGFFALHKNLVDTFEKAYRKTLEEMFENDVCVNDQVVH